MTLPCSRIARQHDIPLIVDGSGINIIAKSLSLVKVRVMPDGCTSDSCFTCTCYRYFRPLEIAVLSIPYRVPLIKAPIDTPGLQEVPADAKHF